jgi:hypothetical protein
MNEDAHRTRQGKSLEKNDRGKKWLSVGRRILPWRIFLKESPRGSFPLLNEGKKFKHIGIPLGGTLHYSILVHPPQAIVFSK